MTSSVLHLREIDRPLISLNRWKQSDPRGRDLYVKSWFHVKIKLF